MDGWVGFIHDWVYGVYSLCSSHLRSIVAWRLIIPASDSRNFSVIHNDVIRARASASDIRNLRCARIVTRTSDILPTRVAASSQGVMKSCLPGAGNKRNEARTSHERSLQISLPDSGKQTSARVSLSLSLCIYISVSLRRLSSFSMRATARAYGTGTNQCCLPARRFK